MDGSNCIKEAFQNEYRKTSLYFLDAKKQNYISSTEPLIIKCKEWHTNRFLSQTTSLVVLFCEEIS